jgi:hypothetical protein
MKTWKQILIPTLITFTIGGIAALGGHIGLDEEWLHHALLRLRGREGGVR